LKLVPASPTSRTVYIRECENLNQENRGPFGGVGSPHKKRKRDPAEGDLGWGSDIDGGGETPRDVKTEPKVVGSVEKGDGKVIGRSQACVVSHPRGKEKKARPGKGILSSS